ncbi:autotransporter domain-containing protein [Sphingomonas flavescens]|uniref:autotransporter domain-containing protein n=1 Tax=Sphingomonas flavescens TaxID=3132797 RepID=UPI002805727E|nr:autotransporter domain-containing protein [Sphingomonas limnosediminicola]
MNRRKISRALAAASMLVLAAVPGAASAQQIDRIIVFGDSYADTGNFFRIAGINPATTGVYTTGRFSGGTNYIDTLSGLLGVPVYNYAIGGARTNNLNQTAGVPGFTTEVQVFLANAGTLGFPTTTTSLDQSDLVAVSIGGNDSRAYQIGGGTLAGAPAAAATAVTSFQTNFDQVMTKGTPTISFLAGDTGRLPEIAANPTGAAVRTAYSNAFNSGVQNILAGYAARGSIVHYLDLTKILDNVIANPQAYGITNGIACPFFPGNTTCAANATGYLVYGDGLHLTSQGFEIVGKYVDRQLAAPLTLSAPTTLGVQVSRQFGRTLSTRTDNYRGTDAAPGLAVYAVGDMLQNDAPSTSYNSAFEVRSGGGTIGAEYGFGGGLVGVAGNYSRPKLRFNNDASRIRGRSWQVGAYGSFEMGAAFAQGYLGYGRDRNRIERTGVVSSLTANPHGTHWTAGAKGGYLIPMSGFRVGPIVAVDYARAKADGYTEAGDPALALNVGSQTAKALVGQAGLEIRTELKGFHPYIDITAEHEFTRRGPSIVFSQTSSPVIVNTWDVRNRRDTYARLSGGGSATISGGLSIDAAIASTLGRDAGQEVSAQLGLKARF